MNSKTWSVTAREQPVRRGYNKPMLTSRDIKLAGFYWYYDAIGGPPVVVEVSPAEAPELDLEVRFTGRDDWEMLGDLAGTFIGPIEPPLFPR